MKVIAINDAPIPERGYYHNSVYLDRAYYKGDIFKVIEDGFNKMGGGHIIIWHDKLDVEMDVDSNNFITLEEYRNRQLDKIL
jgi:hypothetical protein